ncbi:hypothetical protein RB195_016700 [Necator americanus]|uniref:Uncharacterized protein n=1 Tax=Necator americanus TaxID=51031 RepID=A0ABR1C1Q1_NECAM
MDQPEEGSRISPESSNIIKNMPSHISHITVFVSVTLIIVLLMVIAHVVRLIMGIQTSSKKDTPSAIVIQPKDKPKKEIKKKKKASLACKHRSNYNLPSKLMMVDVEVNKEAMKEARKKKKEKELEATNPVLPMAISAPPPYQTIKPSPGQTQPPPRICVVSLEKANSSAQNSAVNSGQPSPTASARAAADKERMSGGTIVSKTVISETYTSRSTTSEKK